MMIVLQTGGYGFVRLQLAAMSSPILEATVHVTSLNETAIPEIRRFLAENTFARVTGLFDPETIQRARERLRAMFNSKNDRKHDPRNPDALLQNFQKLVVGGTQGVNSVPRFVRLFYNPLMDADIFGMHDVFRNLVRFRNLLYGLPRDFTLSGIEDGMWSATRIHHYPRGGGFMAPHTDVGTATVSREAGLAGYVQVILIMSRKGIDFQTGGAYIDVDGERLFFESECDLGDVVIYDGRVNHGVEDIDGLDPLDMSSFEGRLVAMATLFKHFQTRSDDEYKSLMK
jgi:hypothetical protein